MMYKFLLFNLMLMTNALVIMDFSKESDISRWNVVDDGVMGGRSNGSFELNDEGRGVFYGRVSLENNGGFSSLRYRFERINVKKYNKMILKVKGDGKRYQFRLKENAYDRHSYIMHFETTGDWQTIEIPLSEMVPTFRGRRLDLPNYSGEQMEELAFLIGNKKAENFKLEMEYIHLE